MKSELSQLACYTKIGLCPGRIEIQTSNCILYSQVNVIFSKFVSLMLFISANKGLPIHILILSGQMNCTVFPCKAAPLKLKNFARLPSICSSRMASWPRDYSISRASIRKTAQISSERITLFIWQKTKTKKTCQVNQKVMRLAFLVSQKSETSA